MNSNQKLIAPLSLEESPSLEEQFAAAQEEILKLRAHNARLEEELSASRAREAILKEQSQRCPLTNLLNRRGCEEAITTLLDVSINYKRREKVDPTLALEAAAHNQKALAILFVDLDNLKGINEQFSHDGGDAALLAIADEMQKMPKRPIDIVSRWETGDEFLIILSGNQDSIEKIAVERARTLQKQIRDRTVISGSDKFSISVTIGIAFATEDELRKGPLQAIAGCQTRADEKMLAGKKLGRDRIYVDRTGLDNSGATANAPVSAPEIPPAPGRQDQREAPAP